MDAKRTKSKQIGSVILEALIAILIFSLGILSLVGLQATAISTVSDAQYRSTAGFLADQMVGLIWATRQNSNTVNSSDVMASNADQTFACAPCSAASNVGNTYTQAWYASGVAAQLPNATASIVVNTANASSVVTISVGWQGPKDVNLHRHVVSTFID